jgi:hypothetical protein
VEATVTTTDLRVYIALAAVAFLVCAGKAFSDLLRDRDEARQNYNDLLTWANGFYRHVYPEPAAEAQPATVDLRKADDALRARHRDHDTAIQYGAHPATVQPVILPDPRTGDLLADTTVMQEVAS